MTAMELKCLKMELVEELLSIDDKDTLNRVKNYLKKNLPKSVIHLSLSISCVL